MNKNIIFLIYILLSGCAHTFYYSKIGINQKDYLIDKGECRQQAMLIGYEHFNAQTLFTGTDVYFSVQEKANNIKDCMISKGYFVKKGFVATIYGIDN